MVKINKRILEAFPLPLPPLPEQRKIAAILSSVDDAIEATQAVIDQLQVVKKAMMAELLTHGLPGRHTRFTSSEFGPVPAAWLQTSLGEITGIVRRPVEVDPTKSYPQIGVRSHGRGVFHKEGVLGKELGNKRVFWIEPGCLVVNIVFAWEGAIAVTSVEESGMIASHRFPQLRPREVLDLRFLRLLLQTKRGTELLSSLSPGGAGRNRTLNQGGLLKLRLPVPPIEEQALIAASIESVEDRVVHESERTEHLRDLKSALMSVLLTGEVRVTPDPEMPRENWLDKVWGKSPGGETADEIAAIIKEKS